MTQQAAPAHKTITRKSVVFVGYACNNRCVFCMESHKRGLPQRDTRAVLREIALARARGSSYLELIGGEATIRPDIVRLVSFARKQGFDTVMMATNGRMFSYPDFARRILDAGLTDLVFSIHGHTAALHDRLTGSPGSFAELMRGIGNMRRLGLMRLNSNTAIVRPNYRHLPQIGRLLLKLGIKDSEFIFADPNEGGVHDEFEKLAVRISAAAPSMRKLLELGRKNGVTGWHVRYVPLCYFTDYLDQVSELLEVATFKTEHIAQDFVNLDVAASRLGAGRAKSPACRKCHLNARCEGIWKTYAEHWGTDELKPPAGEKKHAG